MFNKNLAKQMFPNLKVVKNQPYRTTICKTGGEREPGKINNRDHLTCGLDLL